MPSRARISPVPVWLGIDAGAVAIALPELAREMPAGLSDLYWALAAFGLGLAAGALSGYRGALAGPVLLLVGSVLCAIAGSPELLIAGRALQGLGLGWALGGARGAVPWIAVLPAGVLGGGLLVELAGWQAVFAAEAVLALGALLIARSAGAVPPPAPLEGRLLRIPSYAGALLAAFALSGTVLAALLFVGLYLESILLGGAFEAAVKMSTLAVPAAAASFASIPLCERFGSRWALAPGLALAGLGLLATRWVQAGGDWGDLVPGLVLTGAGAGLAAPALAWSAAGVVAEGRRDAALRIKSVFLGLGLAGGAIGLGMAFTDNLRSLVKGNFLTLFGDSASDAADFIGTGQSSRAGNEALSRFGEIFFVGAFEDVLLGAGLVAIFAALAVFILVRPEDYEAPT